ncbi:hypothetical protein ACCO45_010282 [Purpureocillium lilacinum]|uniref:Uncharacterized protein n=1 Tax=Purpureocillium lilacinum TaxID=33203 RepID=A0ACC4DGK7_PURLI
MLLEVAQVLDGSPGRPGPTHDESGGPARSPVARQRQMPDFDVQRLAPVCKESRGAIGLCLQAQGACFRRGTRSLHPLYNRSNVGPASPGARRTVLGASSREATRFGNRGSRRRFWGREDSRAVLPQDLRRACPQVSTYDVCPDHRPEHHRSGLHSREIGRILARRVEATVGEAKVQDFCAYQLGYLCLVGWKSSASSTPYMLQSSPLEDEDLTFISRTARAAFIILVHRHLTVAFAAARTQFGVIRLRPAPRAFWRRRLCLIRQLVPTDTCGGAAPYLAPERAAQPSASQPSPAAAIRHPHPSTIPWSSAPGLAFSHAEPQKPSLPAYTSALPPGLRLSPQASGTPKQPTPFAQGC